MRKALVLLLCALAVFAIVSCKQDPPAPEKCIVSFNSEGGSAIAPVSVEKGAKIEEPADPVRVGSYFCGWYTESTYENEYDFSAAVEKSFALYAKWEEGTIYGVTSLNETSADGNKYDKFIVSFPDAKVGPGDVVSITFRTTEPFKQYSIRRYGDNKKFFHEKSSGTYPQFFTDMVEGEDGWTTITYTFPEEGAATQDADASKYPEGGIGFNVYFRNQKMIVGTYMELKAVAINGEEYPLTEASVNPTGDLGNVNAYLEVKSWLPHEVTFDTDGGTEIPSVTVPYGQRVAKPADPTKEGVMFIGWFGKILEYYYEFDFDTTMITDDITIYAKYGAPTKVTFDSQGGSEVPAVTIPAGTPVAKPETDPTKEGVVFAGWYTEAACENAYDFDSIVTEAITLYARWVTAFKVTYNFNYEGGPSKVVEVEPNKAFDTLTQVGRPGYYFDGWFEDAECTTPFDSSKGVGDDTTVYAKWALPTDEYKYTVSDPMDDYGHEEAERIQYRWKSSTTGCAMIDDVKTGDLITFMMKASGDMEKVRFRDLTKKVDFYTELTSDPGNWVAVTITIPKDQADTTGFTLMFYDEDAVVPGDVLEIKALAFNGVTIPIADSSSNGLYPSADKDGCYGPKASLDVIPIVYE